MLARLQQAIVVGLLLLAEAWWSLARHLPPWQMLAGFAVLGAGHALFLALEFGLMHAVNRADPVPRARLAALLRAWARESVIAPCVFLWLQPFRARAWPDTDRGAGAPTGRRGVVLVHGFVCNRGLWNGWMARLAQQGRVAVAVNLEPVFGSIEDYVAPIDAAVRRVTQATGMAPVVVGHSMGGLAIRAWLRAARDDARVAQVVTLGSPHHGTWLARWSVVRNAHQMRLDSGWLAELRQDETPRRRALFTCYHTDCDNIVFPASSAAMPGARNLLIPGVGHVAMVFDRRVVDAVLGQLDAV